MHYPTVSVVVITYNQASFITETLMSIVAQNYPAMEIIVSDDASVDGTQDKIRECATKYPNLFRLNLAEQNQGITGNSNAAFALSTGKYIAFFGGDDIMHPNKLQKQVEFMEEHPECVMCYHDLDVFDSTTGKTIRNMHSGTGAVIPREGTVDIIVRYGPFCGGPSTFMRRSACPSHGFDGRLPIASDWLFWIEAMVAGGVVSYLPEVLARYRSHNKSATANLRYLDDVLKTLDIVESKYPYLRKCAEFARNRRRLAHARAYLSTGNVVVARDLLVANFTLNQFALTSAAYWLLSWLPSSCRQGIKQIRNALPQ